MLHKQRERTHRFPISLFFHLGLYICFAFFSPNPAHAEEPLLFSGVIESFHDITIKPKTSGTIAKIMVKEGGRVKAGDTLMVLDNRLETLEMQRRKLIWEDRSDLDGKRRQREIMENILTANQKLYKETRSISKEDIDKQRLEYERMVAAEKDAEIKEKIEKIEYEMAVEQLQRKAIVSPITGTVVKRFLSEGESCGVTDSLFQLVDNDNCRFICNIDEIYARRLHAEQTVTLNVQTGTTRMTQKAEITFVSPVADPGSGLVTVKAEFANNNHQILPGVAAQLVFPRTGDAGNPEGP